MRRTLRSLLLLWALFSLCQAGAQETPPEVPVGFEQEPLPTTVLTLEDALRRALTNHPDLVQALANIEAQEFATIASTANRFPTFNFSSNAGQSGSTGQPGGASVIRTGIQRSYGLGISLNQRLFDFGRTHYQVKSSELQLAATRLTYLKTRQDVLNRVVQAYFELLRQAQAIEVNQDNVRNAERLLAQAQGFLEAGTGAKIGVIQAQRDLATARFGLVQARGALGRAVASLASALGEEELPYQRPQPIALTVPGWDVDQVRELARSTRPDLLSAGLQVARAETAIKSAKAEYYPNISASAGYNWNDNLFPPMNTSYNVGVSLSVPLINEPTLSSAVGQAEALLEASIASRKATELRVVQEATEALYTLREAIGRSESAGEALKFAEESYRLASERYKVGVGSPVEVSQAQQLLVQARSQELQARFDVQTAIGNLLTSTGQLDSAALLPADLQLDPIFDLPAQANP